MLDRDAFEERAAIAEFCGGLSHFQAETLAAKEQGMTRWEALNAIRVGDTQGGRDIGAPRNRDAKGNLPAMQPASEEEDGPMLERHVQA
jgi:hypothetical protein